MSATREKIVQIDKNAGVWRLGVSADGKCVAFVAQGIYLLDLDSDDDPVSLTEEDDANCLLFDRAGRSLLVVGGGDNHPLLKRIRVYDTGTFRSDVGLRGS